MSTDGSSAHTGTRRWKGLAAVLAVGLTGLLAVGCGDDDSDAGAASGAGEGEVREVQFISAGANTYYAPFFIAKQLGFDKEEGIDLKLENADGGQEVATLMASGKGCLGGGSPSDILPLISSGTEAFPYFTWAYGNIFGLRVPKDSDITGIEQLKGKKIGVSALSGGETPVLRGWLVAAGLDPETDVTLIEAGDETATVKLALERGDIDAYSSFEGDLSALEAIGVPMQDITPPASKELPAGGMYATKECADREEDMIALGRVWAKGSLVSHHNFDAGVCALKEQLPDQFLDENAGVESYKAAVPIQTPPKNAEGQFEWGVVSPEGWANAVETYTAGGLIPEPIDMEPYLKTGIPAEVDGFDQDAFIEQVKQLPADC